MRKHIEAGSRHISEHIPPHLCAAYVRRGGWPWVLEQLTAAAAHDMGVTLERYQSHKDQDHEQ
jgi:hypothetical protein